MRVPLKVILRHISFPVLMISRVLLFRMIMLCKFLAFFFFLLIVFNFFSFFSSTCEFYLSKKQALMPNKIQDLLLLLSKSVAYFYVAQEPIRKQVGKCQSVIFCCLRTYVYIIIFFFFMNGNTEQAQCALSRVCIP